MGIVDVVGLKLTETGRNFDGAGAIVSTDADGNLTGLGVGVVAAADKGRKSSGGGAAGAVVNVSPPREFSPVSIFKK